MPNPNRKPFGLCRVYPRSITQWANTGTERMHTAKINDIGGDSDPGSWKKGSHRVQEVAPCIQGRSNLSGRGGRIRPTFMPAKTLASSFSVSFGISARREGPVAYIGSAVGSTLGLDYGPRGPSAPASDPIGSPPTLCLKTKWDRQYHTLCPGTGLCCSSG